MRFFPCKPELIQDLCQKFKKRETEYIDLIRDLYQENNRLKETKIQEEKSNLTIERNNVLMGE